jgi:transcriptional regulator with XRE-family HTH domain
MARTDTIKPGTDRSVARGRPKGNLEIEAALAAVGPRLRARRERQQATLADVSATSGISPSTLSRLESGARRPTLELLLRLARAYDVPVDDLLAEGPTVDPRVHRTPVRRAGRTIIPLTNRPGDVLAHKMIIEPSSTPPRQRTHAGYEWMYVLAGRLHLLLGELDLVLRPGEVAEFDTRTPHWFGSAGNRPAEVLILFGPQGERMHVRARPGGG